MFTSCSRMTVGNFQVFVVLAFQISVVDVTVMLRNFKHLSQYDDKRGVDSNSLTRRVVTLCGCGALCGLEINACKSFFYQKSEGLCSMYTEDIFRLTLVNASGSKGYTLTRDTEDEVTVPVSTIETPTPTSPTITTAAQETTTSASPATTTAEETPTSTSTSTTTAQETTTSTSLATTTAEETPTSTSTATTTAQETTTSILPATTAAPTTPVPTTAAPPPGCPGGGDDDDDECDDD
ncbi:threonine-rich protein-like [Haliotis rubra]|uniref:threonine-rich protein-like n=1 Tax=Haliotis rubra TaxID=36100 RepID=UPI001EE61EBA|nr:threonine-rich protein-like [Haliotis rubra]